MFINNLCFLEFRTDQQCKLIEVHSQLFSAMLCTKRRKQF
jgi:hypothetical protein